MQPLKLAPTLAVLAGLAGLLMPVAASAQKSIGPGSVEYVFKRGDTLIALEAKYFRKRGDYRTVQRLNKIPDPRKISIGKRIAIPFRLLKYRASEAGIAAFRGDITIRSDGRTIKPATGLNIGEGSELATAPSSFLTLSLEDGSRVSLPSNSKVRITRLRHIIMTDSVDYEFAVDNGRIRSKVTPFDRKHDRYRVRTPVSVSAVRGTDYRTRVDEGTGTAYAETVEGKVDVSLDNILGNALAQSSTVVAVPAGMGAAVTVTGNLQTGTLLAAPELIEPGKVQSEEQLQFTVADRPAVIARRLILSADAGFVDILSERRFEGTELRTEGAPDGRYFAKLTSIAADGFESLPATYAFKRQLSTVTGSASTGDFGYRFKWSGQGSGKRLYRLQIFRDDTGPAPIVDEPGLEDDVLTLSDLPAGDYRWRVGVTQYAGNADDPEPLHKWTAFEKLTVAD